MNLVNIYMDRLRQGKYDTEDLVFRYGKWTKPGTYSRGKRGIVASIMGEMMFGTESLRGQTEQHAVGRIVVMNNGQEIGELQSINYTELRRNGDVNVTLLSSRLSEQAEESR